MYSKPKVCYAKIVNPETGKKVSIFSKLGKKICQNYIYSVQCGGIPRVNEPLTINITNEEPVKYSLWLCPSGIEMTNLHKNICDIANCVDGVGFLPHITLLSPIIMKPSKASEKLKELALQLSPILLNVIQDPRSENGPITYSRNEEGIIPWNQSSILIMERSEELKAAQILATKIFNEEDTDEEDWHKPIGLPHYSLAYVYNITEHQLEITRIFGKTESFIGNQLVLVPTAGKYDNQSEINESVTHWRCNNLIEMIQGNETTHTPID